MHDQILININIQYCLADLMIDILMIEFDWH